MAQATGPIDDNLVLKAARALQKEAPNLRMGRFHLLKRLPAAAGIGGGSADAAAALRPAALRVPPWQGSGAHYAASRALGQATRELVLAALQPWAKVAVFDTDSHGPELAASLFMGAPGEDGCK